LKKWTQKLVNRRGDIVRISQVYIVVAIYFFVHKVGAVISVQVEEFLLMSASKSVMGMTSSNHKQATSDTGKVTQQLPVVKLPIYWRIESTNKQ